MTSKQHLVIDCDAGQDDAIALLLAFGSARPPIEPILVTTVAGNSPGNLTSSNARRVVGFIAEAGFGVAPVHRGMDRAIMRPAAPYFAAEEVFPGWVETSQPVDSSGDQAVDQLVDVVRRMPASAVTICALGPLTNIAMAILFDATFAGRLNRVIWMGGSIGRGNITPAAEFNAYADPESVRIVLTSGVDLVIVPAEIGELAAVDDKILAELAHSESPLASAAASLIEAMGNSSDSDRYQDEGRPMYDPTAIAFFAQPSMFTTTSCHVSIDTNDGPSLGATNVDLDRRTDAPPNALVVTDVEAARFHGYLLESLTSAEPERSTTPMEADGST